MLAAPGALSAQSSSLSAISAAEETSLGSSAVLTTPRIKPPAASIKPLSRIAFGVGFSPLGINGQVATNLNRYLNLRATGSAFNYNIDDITTNGFNVNAKLNLASAGASVDFYPFPNHGFRLSPGVLFYNRNAADATFSVQGGTDFTLDDHTYFASSTDPVKGVGSLGLHTQKTAFTATTGWGNVIPRKGGHLSFPFEIGVAFIGSPTLDIALNSGQVCDAQGQNCVNVATDQNVQDNLKKQIDKYKSDLDPLKTYPIVSFGIAYNFKIRQDGTR
jgi:hypothetical protein